MATIGIGVGAESIRAVRLHRGRITWSAEVVRTEGEALEAALETLLRGMPGGRWRRPRAVVVVGPSLAHLRRVDQLVGVGDNRTVASIVRTNPRRFFTGETEVVTTSAVRDAEGVPWVAAIERETVDAVVRACTNTPVRLEAVTATMAVLDRAIEGDTIAWNDGQITQRVRYALNLPVESRRLLATDASGIQCAQPTRRPELAALDDRSFEYADAFAAARLERSAALVLRPRDHAHRGFAHRVPAMVFAVTLLFSLGAPAVAATYRARSLAARHESVVPAAREALNEERSLAESQALLHEIAEVDIERRYSVLMLASLSQAIVPPTVLLRLQIDSGGGSLTAVTPRAAALLGMLMAVPGLTDPEIIGPVTPERNQWTDASGTIAPSAVNTASAPMYSTEPVDPSRPHAADESASLERVTVNFRWNGQASHRPRGGAP